ncbi:MAG: phosphate ABC transporter permease PstA [Halanaeroarchaeum sp.]
MATDANSADGAESGGFTGQRVSRWRGKVFLTICFAATMFGIVALGVLLAFVLMDALGIPTGNWWLDLQFLTSATSSVASEAGIYPALVGSIYLILLVAFITFPLGVGAAIYLEEYAPNNRFVRVLQINIANLAGVPSVVYGLLGFAVFIVALKLPGGSLLVASMTLSLLILPIVIISAREAIRGVPDSMRRASYGMGATRWQTVKNVVLPEALPGILTGTILALGRAIGETAPLILVGVPTVIYSTPEGPLEQFAAMPMQIYAWALNRPSEEFRYGVMAAGVVTLVTVMILMNSVAIFIRNRYQTRS